ncbi:MAG: type II toxin-antitoxin system VapC family toxin [Sedimentisphaerales bacterium]|nr:type II toxin-antitoxin system VapC family toxin [Sedimentisphaerales bacterium]
MSRLLIDTSAYSRLLLGDPNVREALERAAVVYMSVFVLAELYVGFKGGSKETRNRQVLTRFVSRPTVQILSATQETAEVFAGIEHALKRAGAPLPLNDVWIAAHALETGAVLATFDAHFRKVPGLRLWDLP